MSAMTGTLNGLDAATMRVIVTHVCDALGISTPSDDPLAERIEQRVERLVVRAGFVEEICATLGVDGDVDMETLDGRNVVREKLAELQRAAGRAEAYERKWTPAAVSISGVRRGGVATPILPESMTVTPIPDLSRVALLIELAADLIPREGRPPYAADQTVYDHAVSVVVGLIDRAHAILDPVKAAEQANLDAAAAEAAESTGASGSGGAGR